VKARGVTLVELLIAVAITAFIGLVVGGSYQQVDRAATIVREQTQRYAAARVALDRMSRELGLAFLTEHYDRARYRDRPTLFKGADDGVLFTTMAHVRRYRDARESDQAVVEYSVGRNPGGDGDALFRREKVHIDDESDRGGRTDLVADHVTKLTLRYWDAKRKEWIREWNTRSAERANELPPRILIELEVEQADKRRETFTTQATVVLTAPLEF